MRHLSPAALAVAFAASSALVASAQEQLPAAQFTVQRQPDGSLKVFPKGAEPRSPAAATADKMSAAFTAEPADVLDKLRSQEFWVTSKPDGALQSIYVVPKGETPPDSMITSTAEGSTIAKVSGANALKRYLPDASDMPEVLSELMTNAKNAVCSMPARPSEFGTVVDISAGLGITGRVEFNATWVTTELCK